MVVTFRGTVEFFVGVMSGLLTLLLQPRIHGDGGQG